MIPSGPLRKKYVFYDLKDTYSYIKTPHNAREINKRMRLFYSELVNIDQP